MESLKRKFFPMICLAFLLPETAQALQPHGVLSGANLSNPAANTLAIDVGNVYVDNVAINLANHSAALGAYCLTNGTTIAHNAYYYVYYAFVMGGVNNNYYISSTAPASDGHPSAAITGGGGAGCAIPATTSAVFLGSFLTDNTGQVVPFWRNGDDVQVNMGLALSGSIALTTPALPTTPICGSPVFLNRFPQSASAYLIDILPLAETCTAANTLYVCSVVTANLNCPFAPGLGVIPDPYFTETITMNPGVPTSEYKEYRIPSEIKSSFAPQFCMNGYNGVCGANLVTVAYNYAGYVEKIPLPIAPY